MLQKAEVLDLGTLESKQQEAFTTKATEILYGGAAGGGKSHLFRVASIVYALQIAGLQIYFFRRKRPDLIKNHVEGPKGFRNLLHSLTSANYVQIVKDEIRFSNGSRIFLCHCLRDADVYNYQGSEIHLLVVDELTTFTEEMYTFLRSRVRCPGLQLPAQYKDMFPRIIAGTNPGNVGHHWVRKTFVKYAPPLTITRTKKEEGGMLRQYIPALLEDNPHMLSEDPGYEDRLLGMGSKAVVDAMRWGLWDIVAGAFFDWRSELVLKPFQIPDHWYKFMSYDHGRASPFSVGWWAVADGVYPLDDPLPRGSLVRYREWYGCSKDKSNTGIKLDPAEIAKGIKEREHEDEEIKMRVADPSIFSKQGSKSVAMEFTENGITFIKGNNDRIAGWAQIHKRMKGDIETQQPLVYVFNTCLASLEIIPSVPRCPRLLEDLDTKSEDHIADEWRYAHMCWMIAVDKPEQKQARYFTVGEECNLTYAELLQDDEIE